MKTYEKYITYMISEFEIGDYIKTCYQLGNDGYEFKIIDKTPMEQTGPISPKMSYEIINIYGVKSSCNDRDICLKLKPKEIKNFELKFQVNKYNL